MSSTVNGVVEVWLDAGGDFILDATGDLLLADNSDPNNPVATTQRIQRMLSTVSRQLDVDGTPQTTPGDIFNPDYGVGEPALVDGNIDDNYVARLTALIEQGLANDPTIAPIPPPTVSVTYTSNSLTVLIECTDITGQTVTVGPLQP